MFAKTLIVFFLFASISLEVSLALNPCSAEKMWSNYNKMRAANCINCDKYFHCQGNYEAVHNCRGFLQVTTAETMSNLREWRSDNPADSAADQEANLYGRNGGNCATRYLANYGCAYNPATQRCGR